MLILVESTYRVILVSLLGVIYCPFVQGSPLDTAYGYEDETYILQEFTV